MTHFIGIDDEKFIRGNIPMTKCEVRILALAKAKIKSTDVVLDIGAGTGSLSVEAALLAPEGKVFAVEREAEGVSLIRANCDKFGVSNIAVIEGNAPDVLVNIPLCDVVFVGGSGGKLEEIIEAANNLLKIGGRMIITAVTVETLYKALQTVQAKDNFTVEAFGVQVSRIRKVASYNMLQAINPINIISCLKGGQHG
ncbi:precorrin-6Y C5,15-methyltransferase (decarboxylating) subunit CbiT [Dendrosporobacter sp. 1207_IL3150]|uniref:precorrin-6Y C5,15-methyltransferase (decarboxylating) subunit CbiT n=1 Tax=Dendrosporobacter sp. 1207_IL3150 TaxID=3084054 RepID=UPI002FDB51BB